MEKEPSQQPNTHGITEKHAITQHIKQAKDRKDKTLLRLKTGVDSWSNSDLCLLLWG